MPRYKVTITSQNTTYSDYEFDVEAEDDDAAEVLATEQFHQGKGVLVNEEDGDTDDYWVESIEELPEGS